MRPSKALRVDECCVFWNDFKFDHMAVWPPKHSILNIPGLYIYMYRWNLVITSDYLSFRHTHIFVKPNSSSWCFTATQAVKHLWKTWICMCHLLCLYIVGASGTACQVSTFCRVPPCTCFARWLSLFPGREGWVCLHPGGRSMYIMINIIRSLLWEINSGKLMLFDSFSIFHLPLFLGVIGHVDQLLPFQDMRVPSVGKDSSCAPTIHF